MADTTQSPVHVKENKAFALHRDGVTSADTIADVIKARGMAMSGYEEALIEVIPSGGANPTLGVYFWSEAAGVWLQDETPQVIGPVGVDTLYHALVLVKHRRMFIAVDAIAAGPVSIRVAGHRNVIEGA